jgi:aspartyl-tRNA(Asn)/glutamyl-tRNA(Gln) amidotransferase subunit B
LSEAKLFSAASAKFGGAPNTRVTFFDAGFPGQLPVPDEFCIEQAVKTGLGLGAVINEYSVFARKHYFYADLPSGYQISQFSEPLVTGGSLEIEDDDGAPKVIRIERLHVEQDAGKLTHDQNPTTSLVDFNRAGVGLMEIVSKPDLASPHEVGEYLKKIRQLVRYLGTCDGNMDEGSLRCDVNLSLRPKGSEKLGTRTETKNVNSVRFAMQAVEFEMNRQAEILDEGGKVAQETRLFDEATGATRSMRNKENAIDYRYFPDPDIMPLVLEQGLVERIRSSLPELPDAKKKRFIEEYGLSDYDAANLTAESGLADYFEEAVGPEKPRDGKTVANWIQSELFAALNRDGRAIAESPVSAGALGELIDLIKDGSISGKTAKDIFKTMYEGAEKSARKIAERDGLGQVSDAGEIEKAIDGILASAPENVAAYRAGKTPLFGWFVGQSLKAMKGRGNPALINEMLKKKLG